MHYLVGKKNARDFLNMPQTSAPEPEGRSVRMQREASHCNQNTLSSLSVALLSLRDFARGHNSRRSTAVSAGVKHRVSLEKWIYEKHSSKNRGAQWRYRASLYPSLLLPLPIFPPSLALPLRLRSLRKLFLTQYGFGSYIRWRITAFITWTFARNRVINYATGRTIPRKDP